MAYIPTEADDQPRGGWINKAGTYNVRIDAVEKKISSNGNPMKEIVLTCVETGDKITDRLIETEKAGWKIAIFAKACGVRINKGDALDVDESWKGKTLTIDVKEVLGDTDPTKTFGEVAGYHYDPKISLFLDSANQSAPEKKW